jgi:hypothetical protein
MFRSANRMLGFTLQVADGPIGDVKNLYFDDEKWVVRYLVVAAGGSLSGRRILISPIGVDRIDGDRRLIVVNLTMRQIENSPGIDKEKPISRRLENRFNRYYHYPGYWIGSGLWGENCHPGSLAGVLEEWEIPLDTSEGEEAYRLRSAREVLGYAFHSKSGEDGRIQDFLVDERSWAIGYLIVSTGGPLRREKRLYQPNNSIRVSWSEQRIYLRA